MNIDRYTKVILTVIAACLVILAAREIELIPKAQAVPGDQAIKVQIVGIDRSYGSGWEPLPVRIVR